MGLIDFRYARFATEVMRRCNMSEGPNSDIGPDGVGCFLTASHAVIMAVAQLGYPVEAWCLCGGSAAGHSGL
jgi:hypothetical protein